MENGNDLKPHSLIDVQYFFNTIVFPEAAGYTVLGLHVSLYILFMQIN